MKLFLAVVLLAVAVCHAQDNGNIVRANPIMSCKDREGKMIFEKKLLRGRHFRNVMINAYIPSKHEDGGMEGVSITHVSRDLCPALRPLEKAMPKVWPGAKVWPGPTGDPDDEKQADVYRLKFTVLTRIPNRPGLQLILVFRDNGKIYQYIEVKMEVHPVDPAKHAELINPGLETFLKAYLEKITTGAWYDWLKQILTLSVLHRAQTNEEKAGVVKLKEGEKKQVFLTHCQFISQELYTAVKKALDKETGHVAYHDVELPEQGEGTYEGTSDEDDTPQWERGDLYDNEDEPEDW